MNTDAATLLVARALKQVDNGHCACHVTADQIAELASCYVCMAKRLERIHDLSRRTLLAWADHHRQTEHLLVEQIEEQCTCA